MERCVKLIVANMLLWPEWCDVGWNLAWVLFKCVGGVNEGLHAKFMIFLF